MFVLYLNFECDHFARNFDLIFGIDGFLDLHKHDY